MTLITSLVRQPPLSWARLSAALTYTNRFNFIRAARMSNLVPVNAKPFRLSLIQLGGLGADKAANLAHAKDMILKAVGPVDGKKTDLVVLPVSLQTADEVCRI